MTGDSPTRAPIACQICGAVFTPTRGWAVYDTSACRMKAHYLRTSARALATAIAAIEAITLKDETP